MSSNKISVFNGISPKCLREVDYTEILENIKNGVYRNEIEEVKKIKQNNGLEAYRSAKQQLPAVCFCGTFFTKRAIKNIKTITGFIIPDLDHLENIDNIFELLCQDENIWFAFKSPSGDGIKCGMRSQEINSDSDLKSVFKKVSVYFKEIYNIEIDKACKDISRLTFVSYDKTIFINQKPTYFTWNQPKPVDFEITDTEDWEFVYGRKVLSHACKEIEYSVPGEQHYTRIKQARLVGGYIAGGIIDEYTAVLALENAVIKSGVQSFDKAMRTIHDAIENGKKEPLKPTPIKNTKVDGLPFCYWVENSEGNLVISHFELIKYLQKNGFKQMYLNKKENLDTVHIRVIDNVIYDTNINEIKSFILKSIDNLPEQITTSFTTHELNELMQRNIDVVITEGKLTRLEFVEVDNMTDTKDCCFLYFKNGFMEIEREGCCFKEYSCLEKPIFKNQIINFDYNPQLNFADSEYMRFCKNVCTDTEKGFFEDRYNALRTVIGKVIHTYSVSGNQRAFIFCENTKLLDKSEGGSGKGILADSFKYFRKLVTIGAKGFKPDTPFSFQRLNYDTQIINMDDMTKDFDYESFFDKITGGFEFEKKNKGKYKFPIEKNPTLLITTNYPVKQKSGSLDRRYYFFELTTYYNVDFTPEEDFGHFLFAEWDEYQWNCFYNFIIDCISYYFNNNRELPEYKSDTLMSKRVISAIGKDFYEFFSELEMNVVYEPDALYERFCDRYTTANRKPTKNKFSMKLTEYCKDKNIELERPQKRLNGVPVRHYMLNQK